MQTPFEIVDEAAKMGDAPELANRKQPYYHNKQERPAHRLMIEYAAQGYTVKEIAEMVGCTPVNVNNILRQPAMQQTLVNSIRKHATVDDEVVEVIKRNVVASAEFYERVLNDPKSSNADKDMAAQFFTNRRYGKPTQPMSRASVVDLNNLSDEELASMLSTNGTGTNH